MVEEIVLVEDVLKPNLKAPLKNNDSGLVSVSSGIMGAAAFDSGAVEDAVPVVEEPDTTVEQTLTLRGGLIDREVPPPISQPVISSATDIVGAISVDSGRSDQGTSEDSATA